MQVGVLAREFKGRKPFQNTVRQSVEEKARAHEGGES